MTASVMIPLSNAMLAHYAKQAQDTGKTFEECILVAIERGMHSSDKRFDEYIAKLDGALKQILGCQVFGLRDLFPQISPKEKLFDKLHQALIAIAARPGSNISFACPVGSAYRFRKLDLAEGEETPTPDDEFLYYEQLMVENLLKLNALDEFHYLHVIPGGRDNAYKDRLHKRLQEFVVFNVLPVSMIEREEWFRREVDQETPKPEVTARPARKSPTRKAAKAAENKNERGYTEVELEAALETLIRDVEKMPVGKRFNLRAVTLPYGIKNRFLMRRLGQHFAARVGVTVPVKKVYNPSVTTYERTATLEPATY